MTPVEIAAWGTLAVAVIGAIGGQVRLYRLMTNEFQFARKREYEIHDAVKKVHQEATNAYQEANHVNLKIVDLSDRLLQQGALLNRASEVLPQLQQTTEQTKAAVETVALTAEETKQLAKELHDKIDPAPNARLKEGG